MSCPIPVRVVAVVRKRRYNYKYTLLVECPVGSVFVLQCQRVAIGEICLYAYILDVVCLLVISACAYNYTHIKILLFWFYACMQKTWSKEPLCPLQTPTGGLLHRQLISVRCCHRRVH